MLATEWANCLAVKRKVSPTQLGRGHPAPWNGVSGYTRLVRENRSSVAADQRRTLDVCLHAASGRQRFLCEGLYGLAGDNS